MATVRNFDSMPEDLADGVVFRLALRTGPHAAAKTLFTEPRHIPRNQGPEKVLYDCSHLLHELEHRGSSNSSSSQSTSTTSANEITANEEAAGGAGGSSKKSKKKKQKEKKKGSDSSGGADGGSSMTAEARASWEVLRMHRLLQEQQRQHHDNHQQQHLPPHAVEAPMHRTYAALAGGAGMRLPLKQEAFNPMVRMLDDEATAAAQKTVCDFFGGVVTGRPMALGELDVLWQWRGGDDNSSSGSSSSRLSSSASAALSRAGLPGDFLSALASGAELSFPVLNQRSLAPAFALQYFVDGVPLQKGQSAAFFAAWVASGLPPVDGLRPLNNGTAGAGASGTGMFTREEWMRTVRLKGSTLDGERVVLRAVVATSEPGVLMFVVEPAAVAVAAGGGGGVGVRVELPSANGYAMSVLPTAPLLRFAKLATTAGRGGSGGGGNSGGGRNNSFKRVAHALQQYHAPLEPCSHYSDRQPYESAPAFGFMVQRGGASSFKYYATGGGADPQRLRHLVVAPPEAPTVTQFRPAPKSVKVGELVEQDWPTLAQLLERARATLQPQDRREVLQQLSTTCALSPPSPNAAPVVCRLLDVFQTVVRTGGSSSYGGSGYSGYSGDSSRGSHRTGSDFGGGGGGGSGSLCANDELRPAVVSQQQQQQRGREAKEDELSDHTDRYW